MRRYAVKVKTVREGSYYYHAVGIGLTQDPQYAHLYTKIELAQNMIDSYKKMKNHYVDPVIITVEVTGLE